MCDSTEDLWICLICGHVGCGRYKGGHAKEHWKETAHSFALEIETQHVWDYAGDTWVHRLIRAKGDGKVVELPSNNRGGGAAASSADADDLLPRAKVEAMGLEYTHLLTSQLESQRVYFEEKIAQAADKAHSASLAAEAAMAQAKDTLERFSALQESHDELKNVAVPLLERDLEREKNKAAKVQELARRLTKELQGEKEMTKGINEKVTYLQKIEDERQQTIATLKQQKVELEELNHDLQMYISSQEKLKEMKEEGKVDAEELEEGSASVGEKGRRRRSKK
jgi:BRCA1-associated protein